MNEKSSIWIKYSVKVTAEFVEPVVRMFTKFLTSNVYVEQIGDPEDKYKELNTLVSGFAKKNDDFPEKEFNNNDKEFIYMQSKAFFYNQLSFHLHKPTLL